MSLSFTELLTAKKVIVFDGAMGTEIQKVVADADYADYPGCNEALTFTSPKIIYDIHRSYALAGANVLETNTFGANRIKLAEYGLEQRCLEINTAAVKLAQSAIAEIPADSRPLICGTMGPTGFLPSSADPKLSAISFDELVAIYKEQSTALITAGVDMLLIETGQDLLEMRAAAIAAKESATLCKRDIPLQIQATLDHTGRMVLGSDIFAFLGAIVNLRPAAIGINCSAGPAQMAPFIATLTQNSPIPVSMIPNAGMPVNIDGKAEYSMTPQQFADAVLSIVTECGVAVVGGCCGTTPAHIAALVHGLSGISAQPPKLQSAVFCGSGITGINLANVARPFIIGERLNAQGSKKTKELLLANNLDELNFIASDQCTAGSTILDVCTAVNENDNERQTMTDLCRFLSARQTAPLSIDSVEPDVLLSALKVLPGSGFVNSINLEGNAIRGKQIAAIAAQFGSPIIGLVIDDQGMAQTVERKVELAKQLAQIACTQHNLPMEFLFIDPLVFTLASGNPEHADAAARSIEAIRQIKKALPGIQTVMGVSNVSYGLKPAARRILNNLMLHHAAVAGLDAAIFNPLHLDKVDSYDSVIRTAGENLLFNRTPSSLADFVACFSDVKSASATQKSIGPTVSLDPSEALRQKILSRDRRDIDQIIKTLLTTMEPQAILNQLLLPTMQEIGQKMERGDLILPFVLQSAEVMQVALTELKPYLVGDQAVSKGTIVLATVFGDVHDIGKNLVASILANQGYAVIDMGKQVACDDILKAVIQHKPVAVGLSALLVTTSREMTKCVDMLDKNNLSIPVLIGGAAVNEAFARRIEKRDGDRIYTGGVYFCRDAFEADRVLNRLQSGKATPASAIKATSTSMQPSTDTIAPAVSASSVEIKPITPQDEIIDPPFYGASEVLTWKPSDLLDHLDRTRLYKGYWKAGALSASAFTAQVAEEFDPVFESLRSEILELELLDARALYGYFPVYTLRETMVILSGEQPQTELASFDFPRTGKRGNRSVVDYLRAEGDIIAIQAVTISAQISDRSRVYFGTENKYSRGFYLNGLANFLVETIAEKVTTEIRRGLFIESTAGRRYSFGFPGTPEIDQHPKLFELMSIEERLGITLTSAFQMVPEHSTVGIFVRHPEAEFI